jgi:hypothetical protein
MSKTADASKTMNKALAKVRAEYPETYYTPGVGYCGPGYVQMQARAEILSELRWRAVVTGAR